MTAAALWLAVTLSLTLRPVGWIQSIPFWSFWAQTMAGVDLVQNLVLFAPMGWIANRARWSARRTVATGVLISVGIEFVQQWVPGRASMATDIAFNTAGAAFGWWMATPVRRPRVRGALAFAALGAFLGLHALNTAWPDLAESLDGAGAWQGADRHVCTAPAGELTVCVAVPNTSAAGQRHITVTGPEQRTYVHVFGPVAARPMECRDCVMMKFEWTSGARMRFRPPIARACGLAAHGDRLFEMRIDPRLEYLASYTWEPTRAGAWMWPVWPFESYRPGLLRAVGALTFVIGAAMLASAAPWVIPAGYLLALSIMAVVTGMRGPGLWELGWAAIGWLLATGAVRLEAWWRHTAHFGGLIEGNAPRLS